jgi:hypothetical protein
MKTKTTIILISLMLLTTATTIPALSMKTETIEQVKQSNEVKVYSGFIVVRQGPSGRSDVIIKPYNNNNIYVGDNGATVTVYVDYLIDCPGWADHGHVSIEFEGTGTKREYDNGETATGTLTISRFFEPNTEFKVKLWGRVTDILLDDDDDGISHCYTKNQPSTTPSVNAGTVFMGYKDEICKVIKRDNYNIFVGGGRDVVATVGFYLESGYMNGGETIEASIRFKDTSTKAYVIKNDGEDWGILDIKKYFKEGISFNVEIIGEYTHVNKLTGDRDHIKLTEWSYFKTVKCTPNLECSGTLSLSGRKGGSTQGTFTVENIGNEWSYLDWKIDSYPGWGTWSFNPSTGEGLTGETTVTVNVNIPQELKSEYSGKIKVVNKNDASDYDTVSITLKTIKNKDYTHPVFLEKLYQRMPLLANLLSIIL